MEARREPLWIVLSDGVAAVGHDVRVEIGHDLTCCTPDRVCSCGIPCDPFNTSTGIPSLSVCCARFSRPSSSKVP